MLGSYSCFKGRTTGLEPANGGTTNHCLNHLATLAIVLLNIALESILDLVPFLRRDAKIMTAHL